MATIGPVAGVAFLQINGQQYQLRGSMVIDPTTLEASGVAGQDGVHGYLEKPRVPTIEMDVSDSGGLSVQALAAIRSGTVTGQLANGKTYVLGGAWCEGAIPLDTVEGKMKVKFGGLNCTELGVS